MNNHHKHKKSSSSENENFTFPAMSPDVQIDTELADHLFSNGKFLLHTFPVKPATLTTCMFSRTCSVNSSNSKDSLVSSRSTSTNSRSSSSSSSCSSARTSTSESSPTRVPIRNVVFVGNGPRSPVHYGNNYYYSPAQRWQFMAPVPVLNRRASLRRKGECEKRKESPEKRKCYRRKGYYRMFFRWIVSTCKECHAMQPSKKVF